ncbi:MAG: Ppx/GppA phosphatase family protein [Candidatus Binatia bacterium]
MSIPTKSDLAVDQQGTPSYGSLVSELITLVEVGSNAVRCIVASVVPGVGFQLIEEERVQTRLGGGRPGILAPPAVRATITAVRRFVRAAQRNYQSPRILGVATSAVRDATNRHLLLDPLQRDVGVSIRILSGEEEAQLGARAALWSLSTREGTVLDLGGGSLQLSHIGAGSIVSAASFPLGAVRTTTRFFHHDPPTPQEIEALRHEVQEHCTNNLLTTATGSGMIGLGGTVRTLARMHLLNLNRQRSRQGLVLQRVDITTLREQLDRLPLRQRLRLNGLKPERADIILAGTIVIEEVMTLGNYRTLTVCTGGVRQGLLLHEVFRQGS